MNNAKMVLQILQITDTHLFADSEKKLVGIMTTHSLESVLAHVQKNIAAKRIVPDCIVLSGDISQDYTPTSYNKILNYFKDFPYPIFGMLGNHDNSVIFHKAFRRSIINLDKKIEKNGWLILLLNSHVPFEVGGYLHNNELLFLERELTNSAGKPVLIFVHHHVLPVGAHWLDNINLRNKDSFLGIIDKFTNIKAVVSGHVHQETFTERNNVHFLTTPATCLQFAKDSYNFKLDSVMPGYRTINLYNDGSYKTEVFRIDHDERFIPDLNSTGY